MTTEELQEYTIRPGRWPNDPLTETAEEGREVKFTGREIASHKTGGADATRWTEWTVYETEGGKVVVVTENASRWQGESTARTVEAFDGLDSVPDADGDEYPESGAIPDHVRADCEEALGIDSAVHID